MPRYIFHLVRGSVSDGEPKEMILANLEAARGKAVLMLMQVVRSDPEAVLGSGRPAVLVAAEKGAVVATAKIDVS